MLKFFWGTSFSDVFPDADFCLYQDFPFNQLVFIMYKNNLYQTINNSEITITHTCTSRWIARYYRDIQDYLKYDLRYNTQLAFEAEANMSTRSYDFEKLLNNCNKHTFHARHIWDMGSTRIFTKYIQVILAISSPVILFGIIINSSLVHIILTPKNSDLFKGPKQYPYLCALAVINLITSAIKLFSWLSECNKTYGVFCPETSYLVFFQFFKIIFKETLIVTLRFMSNFAYMAFAFNRIALIGKDHAKIVEKLVKWKFKNYMLLSGLLSMILSIVKAFKYQVRKF